MCGVVGLTASAVPAASESASAASKSASASRSVTRSRDRPAATVTNGSAAAASVHAAGSPHSSPSSPTTNTRSSPQVLRRKANTNSWPDHGWNGWVTRTRSCSTGRPGALDGSVQGRGGGRGRSVPPPAPDPGAGGGQPGRAERAARGGRCRRRRAADRRAGRDRGPGRGPGAGAAGAVARRAARHQRAAVVPGGPQGAGVCAPVLLLGAGAAGRAQGDGPVGGARVACPGRRPGGRGARAQPAQGHRGPGAGSLPGGACPQARGVARGDRASPGPRRRRVHRAAPALLGHRPAPPGRRGRHPSVDRGAAAAPQHAGRRRDGRDDRGAGGRPDRRRPGRGRGPPTPRAPSHGDRHDGGAPTTAAPTTAAPTTAAPTTAAPTTAAPTTAVVDVPAGMRSSGAARSGCPVRPAPSLAGYDELLAAGGGAR